MISRNAIQYTLSHLLKVALPVNGIVDFQFEISNRLLTVTFADNYNLAVNLFSDDEYALFLSGEAHPTLIKSADKNVDVPVFKTDLSVEARNVSLEENNLRIPYDIVTPSFIFLSRLEEYPDLPRDQHARFQYEYSLAKQYDCIDVPLVDEYALLLRQWILTFLKPDIYIQKRDYQFIPTHDIDLLFRFKNPIQAFKSIFGRDLLINKNLYEVRTSLIEYGNWRKDSKNDPYILAIQELIQKSAEHHLTSRFFFKALTTNESDCTYDIFDKRVADIVEQILSANMEIGLHGGYDSYNQAEQFIKEKKRLENVLGLPIVQSRQHYLRFDLQGTSCNADDHTTQSTLQILENAGIQHDYTLGYAERAGFRCGTCHPYFLYDVKRDCSTDITEHPLIVMDGTLLDYMKLSAKECNVLISRLLTRCKAVEGDFIMLWHNHLLSRNYRDIYSEVYLNTLSSLIR